MAGFEWKKSRQLHWWQVLSAVFAPSAFAFIGFHVIVPALVTAGTPALIAWSAVACIMLFIFTLLAIYLLGKEARELGITFAARACLKKVSVKNWLLYLVITLAAFSLVSVFQAIQPRMLNAIGFNIPDYMPFFLKGLAPTTTPMTELSPGFDLRGAYAFLPLIGVTLLFNIAAEELYFRAWLMPKMIRMGHWAWVANGILFALYHTFQLWMLPVLLTASLSFAFIAYLSRSILPSAIIHFITNFLFSILGILYLMMPPAVVQ